MKHVETEVDEIPDHPKIALERRAAADARTGMPFDCILPGHPTRSSMQCDEHARPLVYTGLAPPLQAEQSPSLAEVDASCREPRLRPRRVRTLFAVTVDVEEVWNHERGERLDGERTAPRAEPN